MHCVIDVVCVFVTCNITVDYGKVYQNDHLDSLVFSNLVVAFKIFLDALSCLPFLQIVSFSVL